LVNYFFKEKITDVTQFTDSRDETEDDYESELMLLLNSSEDVAELRDMIKPEDVIAAVKTYIEDINVESGPVGSSSVGGSKGIIIMLRIHSLFYIIFPQQLKKKFVSLKNDSQVCETIGCSCHKL